jgi:hypothetical protein
MNRKPLAKVAADAPKALDHLLLGISDLDGGVRWMQDKAGVQAAKGGCHPGAGTRNALVSLGNLQYVEIISLDPTQKQAGRMAALVHDLMIPQLIAWAVATKDIDASSQQIQAAGYQIEGPSKGERVKPNGGVLKWKTLRVLSRFGDVIPFFIEWDAAVTHPSQDAPSGCSLEAFEIEHPEADPVQTMLLQLGIRAAIRQSNRPRLKAILSTPKGIVEL